MCLLALVLVIIALVRVIAHDTSVLTVWLLYFVVRRCLLPDHVSEVPGAAPIYYSVQRAFKAGRTFAAKAGARERGERWFRDGPVLNYLLHTYHGIVSQSVVFFVDSGSLSSLNKATLCCRANDSTCRWCTCTRRRSRFRLSCYAMCPCWPSRIRGLRWICCSYRDTPARRMVAYLSEQLGVPRNRMFMECPKTGHPMLSHLHPEPSITQIPQNVRLIPLYLDSCVSKYVTLDFKHKVDMLGGVRIIAK